MLALGEFVTYGASEHCLGCIELVSDGRAQDETEECRLRLEVEMQKTELCRLRLRAAAALMSCHGAWTAKMLGKERSM